MYLNIDHSWFMCFLVACFKLVVDLQISRTKFVFKGGGCDDPLLSVFSLK